MNDEPQHKHRKYWLLCVFAVFIAILGVVLPETEFTPLTYINASNISYSGLVNVNGNLSDISEINHGNWSADETTSPWWINITFINVTHFSFPEIKLLYFSTVGASTHVNDIEIYCITEHTFVDLSTFTNQIEWLYWTRHIPDSMHFVDANGNVTIRLNHSSNGNTNHRIKLDVVRLVEQSQFEAITTTLIQHFNTTTTGTGSQNLSQVLDIGENANYKNITNLSSINNDVRFSDTNNTMQLNVPSVWINETGGDVSQAVNADNRLYTFLTVTNHTTTNQALVAFMNINNNGWPYFLAKRARGNITNSTLANVQGVLTDDYLLRFTAAGWYKNGTAFTGSKAAIDFRVTNDWNRTSNPTYISISTTANGSTTLTERLRVWDNGSIQIISMASSSKTYLCQDHGFIVAGTPGC